MDLFLGPASVHTQQLVSGFQVDNLIVNGVGADEALKTVRLDRIGRVHNRDQKTPDT
jgi:hypothetical protein